nr:MAG TPA: hypothetical protein [Caudoviricetes sp.]
MYILLFGTCNSSSGLRDNNVSSLYTFFIV